MHDFLHWWGNGFRTKGFDCFAGKTVRRFFFAPLCPLREIFLRRHEDLTPIPWRGVLQSIYYIQSELIVPDFVVDISSHWNIKMNSIRAFKTQFFDPASQEPETFISKPSFLTFLEGRAKEFGQSIGVEYGEGFTVERSIGTTDLFSLL